MGSPTGPPPTGAPQGPLQEEGAPHGCSQSPPLQREAFQGPPQGAPRGAPPKGPSQGLSEGAPQGAPQGLSEGAPQGPPEGAPPLVAPILNAAAAEELSRLPFSSVVVVTIALRAAAAAAGAAAAAEGAPQFKLSVPGFGYLVSPEEALEYGWGTMGALSTSRIFKERGPPEYDIITAFVRPPTTTAAAAAGTAAAAAAAEEQQQKAVVNMVCSHANRQAAAAAAAAAIQLESPAA
ncbi:hypothetical protein, conserved [Eimeria praecox]|uniref:Uncharacterized protein n=1 Tax=Eimeria praecox TaxID=51316 RepID=U6G3K1_9EIME|nr:hypothetical protein, conserved [Eimeria praecox]